MDKGNRRAFITAVFLPWSTHKFKLIRRKSQIFLPCANFSYLWITNWTSSDKTFFTCKRWGICRQLLRNNLSNFTHRTPQPETPTGCSFRWVYYGGAARLFVEKSAFSVNCLQSDLAQTWICGFDTSAKCFVQNFNSSSWRSYKTRFKHGEPTRPCWCKERWENSDSASVRHSPGFYVCCARHLTQHVSIVLLRRVKSARELNNLNIIPLSSEAFYFK